MDNARYKELSIKEFTKAADVYDSGHAGIYEMCKDDYPPILDELNKADCENLLDVGCGTGPMIELLASEFPSRHYTGLDLTPRMLEVASAKDIESARFVVGDAEDLPFDDASFDTIICANSFDHYPKPRAFFGEASRVLRPSTMMASPSGATCVRCSSAPASTKQSKTPLPSMSMTSANRRMARS